MKPKKVILVNNGNNPGSSNQAASSQSQSGTPDQSKSKWKKLFNSTGEVHPFILFCLAIVLTIVIRLVAGALLVGTSMGFVWQEILKTFFVILILGAYSVLSSKGGAVGISVIILAILLMISNIARHDYSSDRSASASNRNDEIEQTRPNQSKIDFLRLEPGTHVFELEAGEVTPWRAAPNGKNNLCGYSSESYDYIIIFSDGTSYPGGPDTRIPEKHNVFWKIKANSKQTVYVTIL
mgnify:CR=1 FL=1